MKTLRYLDTCYPDYFNGSPNEVLIALHHKSQTVEELFDSLVRETNNTSYPDYAFEAMHNYIDNYKKEFPKDLDKQAINEDFLDEDYGESDENLVHYFEVIES